MKYRKLKVSVIVSLICTIILTVTASAVTVVPRITELTVGAAVSYDGQTVLEKNLENAWKTAVSKSQTYNDVTFTLYSDWKAGSGGFGSGDGFENGAITYKSGRGVTIDLNGHTLNRNLTGDKTGGCILRTAGKLTVTDSSDTKSAVLQGGYNDDEGGAIVLESGAKFTINGCTVRGCKSDSDGGAVYLEDYSCYFTANGTSFEQNWSDDYGGVIFCEDGTVTLTDCIFSRNVCECAGGAVCVDEGTLNVSGCTFTDNRSEDNGGAIYINTETKSRIENSTFERNAVSDDSGGAVYVDSSDGTFLIDCTMKNNRASEYGGAVCINGDRCFIIGGEYTGNTASSYGGGIYCDSLYDMNIAGKLVITGNKMKTKDNNLCLQSGYFSTAYVYCGGMEEGSCVSLSSTNTSSNLAVKGIDLFQYENYIRFDAGFMEDKRVRVNVTGDTVRVEGSAVGHGSILGATVLLLIAVVIGTGFYLVKKRKGANTND